MQHRYRYLIVGGGMAADAAVDGIRSRDKDGSIGIVSSDADPPYSRPPLSKALWKGDPLDSVWRHTEDKGATLHLGRTVRTIDRARKQIGDGSDDYVYEKLLIATGGTPRRLKDAVDGVIYYRTLGDYRRLHELATTKNRFAVIGGGFIGSEIAAALALNGRQVTLLFPDAGINARALPADLSHFVTDYYRKKGVEILAGEQVTAVASASNGFVVATDSGKRVEADAVVAGLGIELDVALARGAGLSVDNGIVVNGSLQTDDPDIFAAGDVVSFFNPALGKRMRVEHEDNALTMGKMAGEAMAGGTVRYDHLPFFYSDLFDLGYEAVGEIDSRHEIFADWNESFRNGVVYYLKDGRVRGVLLWGIFGKTDEARALIADAGPFKGPQLKGRIRG